MRILICKLVFKDGREVIGRLEAASARVTYPVTYQGVVELLPKRLEQTHIYALKMFFKAMAHDLGAELNIEEVGQYDRWVK